MERLRELGKFSEERVKDGLVVGDRTDMAEVEGVEPGDEGKTVFSDRFYLRLTSTSSLCLRRKSAPRIG